MSVAEIEHLLAMFLFFQVLNKLICLAAQYIMAFVAVLLYSDVMMGDKWK
jgi:hypothetical protein